jgi:sugar phosphate isomerase/epimerase
MPSPIALQLYTIRDAMKQDFTGSVQRIADMGFAGVETAGEYGESPEFAASFFAKLGLKVAGAHLGLPIGENQTRLLDIAAALGTPVVICAWLPAENFQSLERIQAVADQLNEANANVRAQGLRFGYHNHHFEFVPLPDGSIPHDHLRRLCDSSVEFELDTYWIQTGGSDPAKVVREIGAQAPLLHIKDGPARLKEPFTAVGEGVVDVPAIVEAGKAFTEWLIVEIDTHPQPFEAVEKSLKYLESAGLGQVRARS